MKENDDSIIQELKKFSSESSTYFSKSLSRMKSDLNFVGGAQYSDKADRNVRGEGRAEMVFNITRNYCNQIINQFRKKPYGMVVSARTPEAKDKAVLAQGLIRGWESTNDSVNDVVIAIDRQVKCGTGYVVLSTEFTEEEGWDQDIKVCSFVRPDMVIADQHSKKTDGSDSHKLASVEHISEESAREMYGEDVNFDQISCALSGSSWEAPEGSVALVTYFKLKKTSKKSYLTEDGDTIDDDEKNEKTKVLKTRDVNKTTVCVYKIIGDKVISETELPLSRIPVIPFKGEMIDVDGKTDFVGLVYFAKDPARLVNWSASLTAERIAISPKTTRFVDFKSIANYKDIWQKANKLNVPFLPYDSKIGDETFAPPVTDNPSVDISSSTQAQSTYQGMLSSILGMQEAGAMSDGASNETAASVLTRSRSNETSNYQYMDNASKSIKSMYRVLLEMMNFVYDTERKLPYKDEDGMSNRDINVQEENLIPSEFELSLDAGPMLSTQRKEELQGLLAIGSLLGPDATMVFAEDLFRNSDVDGAGIIADKMKAYAESKGIGAVQSNQQDPEAVQALQQASEVADQLKQQIDQQQLYIQQLQAQQADKNLELQVAREKMQMDYKKAIDVKMLDLQGAQALQSQELQAKAESEFLKAQTEVDKVMNQPPQITVFNGAEPRMNAVDGQRNDLFR